VKEYWPEFITRKSFERLLSLNKEFLFVLIGGWAIYFYTKAHKSKDIDIVVSLDTFHKIRSKYEVRKNERLKKYEIKEEGFDIYIYVEHFSELPVAIPYILKDGNIKIEGINVAKPKVLLMLKLEAYKHRKGSIKGVKDSIDIVNLLYAVEFDFKELKSFFTKFGHPEHFELLKEALKDFQEYDYTPMNFKEFKKWQKDLIAKLYP
jgi:hypothetical protein